MQTNNLENFCNDLMNIKNLYIFGRANQHISRERYKTEGKNLSFDDIETNENYMELGKSFQETSIKRLWQNSPRFSSIEEEDMKVILSSIVESEYCDFEPEFINQPIKEFFGSIQTVKFAKFYYETAEDFNGLMNEYIIY